MATIDDDNQKIIDKYTASISPEDRKYIERFSDEERKNIFELERKNEAGQSVSIFEYIFNILFNIPPTQTAAAKEINQYLEATIQKYKEPETLFTAAEIDSANRGRCYS